jgi:hypothetical protein
VLANRLGLVLWWLVGGGDRRDQQVPAVGAVGWRAHSGSQRFSRRAGAGRQTTQMGDAGRRRRFGGPQRNPQRARSAPQAAIADQDAFATDGVTAGRPQQFLGRTGLRNELDHDPA